MGRAEAGAKAGRGGGVIYFKNAHNKIGRGAFVMTK